MLASFRFVALALAVIVATIAGAAAQTTVRVDVNVDAQGVALSGYDPVAYFTQSKPTPGDAAIVAEHNGATYRFASEDNRKRFLAAPARYTPVYGGFCAYGVSQGYKVKIDPTVFRVVDGRLYLNYDPAVGRQWVTDIPGYISKANQNWPGLKDGPRM